MQDKKVLVVDDDDHVLYMAEEILLAEGYEVILTTCVSEAREVLLDAHQIDLVISDFNMSGETGIDLLFWMKESLSDSIPFLLWTADTDPQKLLKNAGVLISYLQKPFDVRDFVNTVKDLLSDPTPVS